ncbi:MAG: anti-sigma factor antagonist [bacterium]
MNQDINQLLDSPSADMQIKGLKLLMEKQVYILIPRAVKLITSPEKIVADLARNVSLFLAESCMKISYPPIPKAVYNAAAAVIKKLNPEFINKHNKALEGADSRAIIEAMIVLKYFIKPGRAADILEKFIKYPDERVRATAALHMGMVASQNGIDVLTRFIDDEDSRVRANTIEVLESLGNKNLVRVLSRFRKDNNNRVRGNAIKALFTLGERDLFVDIGEMLAHKEPLMRITAVWVIGEIGGFDKMYLPLLEGVVDDNNELLQKNLSIVVKKVGNIPEIEFLKKKLTVLEQAELKARIERNAEINVLGENRNHYFMCRLNGNIIVDTVLPLRIKLQSFNVTNRKQLVFDLKNIEYIDSSGVALLVNISKEIDKNKGRFFIFGCQPRVAEVFQVSNVNKVMNIFESEDEVLNFIFNS